MKSTDESYASLLAEYTRRFSDVPPSILSEEGAKQLMIEALRRGAPIKASDMSQPRGGSRLS
jgi:hypothetical protein